MELDSTTSSTTMAEESETTTVTKDSSKDKWFVTDKDGDVINDLQYSFKDHRSEDQGKILYSCEFMPATPGFTGRLIFAAVGGIWVTLYEAATEEMKLLRRFEDPNPKEDFYACAWSIGDNNEPSLAAGGENAVVRIFYPFREGEEDSCPIHYGGRWGPIYDLRIHPQDQNLLLAASADHVIRLWNVKTHSLVAIFGGPGAHRTPVLSADIDAGVSRLVSCGQNHVMAVWDLQNEDVRRAIEDSYNPLKNSKAKARSNNVEPEKGYEFDFNKALVLQYSPQFLTRRIHSNYVDCARWYGGFIFSKSTENEIICWKVGSARDVSQSWGNVNKDDRAIISILKLEIEDCEVRFVKFTLDLVHHKLAVGNKAGKTFVYDIDTKDVYGIPDRTRVLTHTACTSMVRHTAFSPDGKTLICVCDDGSIWRWNISKGQ